MRIGLLIIIKYYYKDQMHVVREQVMHCYRAAWCGARSAGRRGLRSGGERGGVRGSAYLTDLEVELAPPLLRLEAEHGGEHRAQGAAWLHVHEHFHLETNYSLSQMLIRNFTISSMFLFDLTN